MGKQPLTHDDSHRSVNDPVIVTALTECAFGHAVRCIHHVFNIFELVCDLSVTFVLRQLDSCPERGAYSGRGVVQSSAPPMPRTNSVPPPYPSPHVYLSELVCYLSDDFVVHRECGVCRGWGAYGGKGLVQSSAPPRPPINSIQHSSKCYLSLLLYEAFGCTDEWAYPPITESFAETSRRWRLDRANRSIHRQEDYPV